MRPMRKWLFGHTLEKAPSYPMSKEQLDAIKEQLLSEENQALRQSVLSAYLEEPERGANMIIAFATDKGLKLGNSDRGC